MHRREFVQGAASLALAASLPPSAPAQTQNQTRKQAHRQTAGLSPREVLLLDDGWKFHRNDTAGGEAPSLDDQSWTDIRVPHDWSIAGPFAASNPAGSHGAYLPTGIGWYRRTFATPADDGEFAVRFDGVYMNSDVWINGHLLGNRPYGYTTFRYDLTPFLHADQPNVLAVRVDNSLQPNCRWYSGSGIYRHVWLERTPTLAIAPWGIGITTHVAGETATANIALQIINRLQVINHTAHSGQATAHSGQATAHTKVFDPHGKLAGEASSDWTLSAQPHTLQQSIKLATPALWSPETPALYRAVTTISQNGRILDEVETPFGVRTARFDHNTGFWLNGKNIKLRGVCIHHDLGALGAAFSEPAMERRLHILKSMGCNALRLTHNPAAPQLLDMCDRLGFLVIGEAFDEWTVGKRGMTGGYHLYFNQWAERDLRDMIARDRNHPSIILWSIGNEIPNKGEPSGVATCKQLVAICHDADPSRPVTAGNNGIRSANLSGFAQQLDVVGYNGGGGSAFEYAPDHTLYPTRKVYGSEQPHTLQTRGIYVSGPDYASSYDENFNDLTCEDSWRLTRDTPYIGGEFRWAGIDYLGEPSPHRNFHLPERPGASKQAWPARSGEFGVIDTCGLPKDAFFFYQSQWTTAPMLHLFPHWTWPGRDGKPIRAVVYTNCDLVDLQLNGHSLGKKFLFPGGPMHLEWETYYQPGTLRAVGFRNNKKVCEMSVVTAADPTAVQLTAERTSITADGNDLVYIRAKIIDARGTPLPDAHHRIHFTATGPAALIAVDNGDPLSHEPFQATSIPAFSGECIAILRSTGKPGHITITGSSEGLQPASVNVLAG